MPAGAGRYTVGKKGSHGCKGYPVVGGEGKVHGCHATLAEAQAQQAAIYASQAREEKSMDTEEVAGCSADAPCGNCEKCMTKGCTDMTKDCGNPMCKVCSKKMFGTLGKDYTKAVRVTYQAEANG